MRAAREDLRRTRICLPAKLLTSRNYVMRRESESRKPDAVRRCDTCRYRETIVASDNVKSLKRSNVRIRCRFAI